MTADLSRLKTYLARIPAVEVLDVSAVDEEPWWVMIEIDIRSPLAWHVVQELGHVLNYLSITERLPCVFKPISPPPYMNGGPCDFLSWLIEATEDDASPDLVAEFVEGRLPRPVEDRSQWPEKIA